MRKWLATYRPSARILSYRYWEINFFVRCSTGWPWYHFWLGRVYIFGPWPGWWSGR